MCLAIWKPKGVQIAKRYLVNGYQSNDDGCGFAYAHKGRLIVEKGFQNFAEFWKSFKPVQNKHAMLIHFRFATSGAKDSTMAHPFLICDGTHAVIHNGIINTKSSGSDSDTATFSNNVLQPLFEKFPFNCSLVHYLVETSVGSGNKICVLRSDGKFSIYNEDSGHWHKGAWYSNKGYEESPVYKWNQTTGGYCSYSHNYGKVDWSKTTTVNDADETANEALEQQALADLRALEAAEGIPDAESSNKLDYSGTSAHREIPKSAEIHGYWNRLLGHKDDGK